MNIRTTLTLAVLAVAAASMAQSRPAFKEVDEIQNVIATLNGTQLTIQVLDNPNIIRGEFGSNLKTSPLDVIEGVYLLGNDGRILSDPIDFSVWNASNLENNGAAAGWKTQQKNGLTAGDIFTYDFNTIGDPSQISHVGYKVNAEGVNSYIYAGTKPVPEPGTMAALGIAGLVGFLRRRRKA